MGFLVENEKLSIHLVVYFSNIPVISTANHKYYLQSVFSRVNKTIGLLRKLQPIVPRNGKISSGNL